MVVSVGCGGGSVKVDVAMVHNSEKEGLIGWLERERLLVPRCAWHGTLCRQRPLLLLLTQHKYRDHYVVVLLRANVTANHSLTHSCSSLLGHSSAADLYRPVFVFCSLVLFVSHSFLYCVGFFRK